MFSSNRGDIHIVKPLRDHFHFILDENILQRHFMLLICTAPAAPPAFVPKHRNQQPLQAMHMALSNLAPLPKTNLTARV
jgi:hypothetical protein